MGRNGENRKSLAGFTLIELMMVSAIIGLLASIAIPKFGQLITKTKEASIKGDLGALRSALTIYYADTEGNYPYFASDTTRSLNALTRGNKYAEEIPSITIPTVKTMRHTGDRVYIYPGINDTEYMSAMRAWSYPHSSMGSGPPLGPLRINCTHKDTGGRAWSAW